MSAFLQDSPTTFPPPRNSPTSHMLSSATYIPHSLIAWYPVPFSLLCQSTYESFFCYMSTFSFLFPRVLNRSLTYPSIVFSSHRSHMFLDIRIARVLILELSTMPPFSFSTELVPIPYIVPSPRLSRLDSSVTCSRRPWRSSTSFTSRGSSRRVRQKPKLSQTTTAVQPSESLGGNSRTGSGNY